MRTTVISQPGAHHGRAYDLITRELDDTDLTALHAELAQVGVRVEPVVDVFHTVHLWALAETTTEQEVRALRIVAARTDARIAWHSIEGEHHG